MVSTNMSPEFWLKSWEDNRIAFHADHVNPFLIKYAHYLRSSLSTTVFVPLCGKTKDMVWLVEQGFKVVGVELSPIACQDFFKENKLDFTVTEKCGLRCYQNKNITLYCGNIFDFKPSFPVVSIYDHAALAALPCDLQEKYAKYIDTISEPNARMLLTTCVFNSSIQGPPFTVKEADIKKWYRHYHQPIVLDQSQLTTIPPHLIKKQCTSALISINFLKKTTSGAETWSC